MNEPKLKPLIDVITGPREIDPVARHLILESIADIDMSVLEHLVEEIAHDSFVRSGIDTIRSKETDVEHRLARLRDELPAYLNARKAKRGELEKPDPQREAFYQAKAAGLSIYEICAVGVPADKKEEVNQYACCVDTHMKCEFGDTVYVPLCFDMRRDNEKRPSWSGDIFCRALTEQEIRDYNADTKDSTFIYQPKYPRFIDWKSAGF